MQQGHLDRARVVLQRVLGRHKAAGGEDDSEVLKTMNNLANILMAQDDHQSAWDMHTRVQALRVQQLGASHPDTVCSLFNLACCASVAGWIPDALRMLQEATRHGFSDTESIRTDSDLAALRKHRRKQVEELAKEVEANGARNMRNFVQGAGALR